MAVRLTQLPFEVIAAPQPSVRLTQCVFETVVLPQPTVRLTQFAFETVVSPLPVVRLTQFVLEAVVNNSFYPVGTEVISLWNVAVPGGGGGGGGGPRTYKATVKDGIEPAAITFYGDEINIYEWGY